MRLPNDILFGVIEKKLKSAKVRDFEIYLERKIQLSYEIKDQELESSTEAVLVGLGLRVFHEKRVSFVYSTDLRKKALEDLCQAALERLPLVDPDEDYQLPETPQSFPSENLQDADDTLASISSAEKIRLIREMEAAAKGADARIRHVRGAAYEERETEYHLLNSRGLRASHHKTLCLINLMAVAEAGGEAEVAEDFDFSPFYRDLNPIQVGKAAALRATGYLGAITPPTQKGPVVLHPLVVGEILESLVSSFQGDEIYKGKSYLRGKMGQRVYSPLLHLIDDPLLPKGIESSPFDGEGQPSRKKVLVEKGEVKAFLLNDYYGKKLGQKGNGSAVRKGFKRPPQISCTNLWIEKGNWTDEQIFAQVGEGVFVTEVIGMHAADEVTGDFSVGIQGFLIEKGTLSSPVKKLTMGGNLHRMMSEIKAVGSHWRQDFNIGAPTLAIQEMMLSGE